MDCTGITKVDSISEKLYNAFSCNCCSECCKKKQKEQDIIVYPFYQSDVEQRQVTYRRVFSRADSEVSVTEVEKSRLDSDRSDGHQSDRAPVKQDSLPTGRQESSSSDRHYSSSSAGRHDSSSTRHDSTSTTGRHDSASSVGSMDFKRTHSTPIIDLKPIEFWAANRAETVQPGVLPPKSPKTRLPSSGTLSVDDFQKDLYVDLTTLEEEVMVTHEETVDQRQLGEVHFSVLYEIVNRLLTVTLMKARDLPRPVSQDVTKVDMSHSNPYAKISLLPSRSSSAQSNVQKKTQHPEWHEEFTFEIPYKELEDTTLEILVRDFDKYSRHCAIGQVQLPLGNINLAQRKIFRKPLKAPVADYSSDLGEILVSLNYLPSAGRLTVDVIKAKQLLQTSLSGGADPFFKVVMVQNDKIIKLKKTSCKKNTTDPVFNESFSFNITSEQMSSTSIVVVLVARNIKSRYDSVGRIVLGDLSTGPTESQHWKQMKQTKRVAQWHTLKAKDECDSMCTASTLV